MAEEQRLRASRIRYAFCIVVILVVIGSTIAYLYYLQKKRKKEQEYQALMTRYLNTRQELGTITQELMLLRTYTKSTIETETLLQTKEQRVQILEEDLRNYQHILHQLKAADRESILRNSDIVHRLRQMTGIHTVRQGAKIALAEKERPNQEDWNLLIEMVKQCLPLFYAHLNSHLLTDQEWKTCLLLRIGFKPNEVSMLLDTLPSRVSKLKALINKKLFNEDGPESLIRNFKSI